MPEPRRLSAWHLVWAILLLLGPALWLIYAFLPADGATGDLESFAPGGFRVQWLLEQRPGGLRQGDLILRGGGYTYAEWLNGAPRGPEWRSGEIVTYEVLRAGERLSLPIRLGPIPLRALLARWGPQLLVALAQIAVGSYVFWRRPREPAARVLMLFTMTLALHLWGDGHNIQFAALPWPDIFWLQFSVEYGSFCLAYGAILHFTLIFPAPHPLVRHRPVVTLAAAYLLHPLAVAVVMASAGSWSAAMVTGSHISFVLALAQAGLAIAAGVRSARATQDPVHRAQIQWILWGASLAAVVALPGYIVPLILSGSPLLPHPAVMLLSAFVPAIFAIAVLRYRLFAIDVIINRTLVYGTLTLLLGGTYLGLVWLLTLLVRNWLQWHNQTLVIFLSTMSIALAFYPLRQRIQRLVDRAFYRDKVDSRQVLLTFSQELRTIIDLPDLLRTLVHRVTDLLHIAHGAVLLVQPDGSIVQIESLNTPPLPDGLVRISQESLGRLRDGAVVSRPQDTFFPLLVPLLAPRTGGWDLAGVLALGPRRSGMGYTRDDIDLLLSLGEQAGMAMRVAQLIDEKRAEVLRKESAEAANQAKSAFLAHMSHELRTPLSAILGYAELLQQRILEQELRELLPDVMRIRQAGNQLLMIISNILDLSKIEAGKMDLALETFDLRALLDEVLLICVPLVDRKNNTLKIDVPDEIGTMRADKVKLRQVLINLLSNAAKFTSQGQVILSVRREAAQEAEQAACPVWLRFRVTDTGIGMTPEQAGRIFQAFTQATPTTARVYGGTGLGLTISKRFCQLMGGRIEVKSAIGQGSTFTVHLPAEVPGTEAR